MRTLLLNPTATFVRKCSMTIVYLLIASTIVSAQWSFTRDECGCKAESAGLAVAVFDNTIRIETADALTVVSSTGLYDPASADLNNPTPLPEGFALQSDAGAQVLTSLTRNNEGWAVVLTDGTRSEVITSLNTCSIPDQRIKGDPVTCISNTEYYSIDATPTQIINLQWQVTGGTIIEESPVGINVLWDPTVGTYNLSYTAQAPSYPGSSVNCDLSGMMEVELRDEPSGAIVCNDLENISLNGNCELDIVADMILEAQEFPDDSYDLIFRDIEADTIITGPEVSMEYVNKIIEVRVVHDCGGNYCIGKIRFEDKSIPPLKCGDDLIVPCRESSDPESTGFPMPATATIVKVKDKTYTVSGYDNCSDVTLTYTDDVIEENLCEGPYSATYTRKWRVVDPSGNMDTCSQKLSIERETLESVTFPGNWDDILGPNPTIEACTDFATDDNGFPHPDLTGRPEGIYCMNAEIQYKDILLEKCGEHSYKVRRTWTVIDLCTDTVLEDIQYITVMDRIAPVCTVPETIEIGTIQHSCTGEVVVAPPVVEDCSGWSYTVGYNPVDSDEEDPYSEIIYTDVEEKNGQYTIKNLPSSTTGYVYIIYTITDDCGNQSRCYTAAHIIDDIAPTPICLQYTYVSLNEKGESWAGVKSFDDGSHDNCAVDSIDIRRMDDKSCGITNVWGSKVKFCCDDIGTTVMVRLRVHDMAGNTNECMVEVEVQDNLPPVFTHCPKDVDVDCTVNTDNLEVYGLPEVVDNCSYTLQDTVIASINDCGVGTLRRVFTATDPYGNASTCTQLLHVKDQSPFYINTSNHHDTRDDIQWPRDHTITNGCIDSGVKPESLPAGKQKPLIVRETCGRIGIEYKDDHYTQVDGACFKILRKWTVIDWCHYHDNDSDSPGIWEYTQVIKVENSTAPTFTKGCHVDDFTHTFIEGCKTWVTGDARATDDCQGENNIRYRYELDKNNNGVIDTIVRKSTFSEVLLRGDHKVTWYATDECGNTSTCDVLLKVRDTKAPTPYCYGQVVTVVMENVGSVELWAKDFDLGSYDNCFAASELKASFDAEGKITNRVFACKDIKENGGNLFTFPLYITDPDGNQDFCDVTIKIQDNHEACEDDTPENSTLSLAGRVRLENQTPVSGIAIEAKSGEQSYFINSDDTGLYAFSGITSGYSCVLVPKDREDHRTAVNTRDLIGIQRHLLGQDKITSPYALLAADADGSKSITPNDLFVLRKLILNLTPTLENSPGWRFLDATKTYDKHSVYNYEGYITMNNMTEAYHSANFVAVKVGDVNNSYEASLQNNRTEQRSTSTLSYTSRYVDGETIFALKVEEDSDILGFQFALNIPQGSEAYVTSDLGSFSSDNYSIVNDILYVSYSGLDAEKELLNIHIPGKIGTTMLTQNMAALNAELYTLEADQVVTRDLDIRSTRQMESTLMVQQNTPNPFKNTTTITYSIAYDQPMTLSIHDMTGKLIHTQKQEGRAGSNQFTVHVDEIKVDGMLYYTVEGVDEKETNKMIIIR